jgi:LysM repeat protein
MKRVCCAVLLLLSVLVVPLSALAQSEEPTIYIIKKGDTLWGLSDRFLKDPFYWPDLWARNQTITNPHLIYPGQRLKVYSDRIEIEEVEEAPGKKAAPSTVNLPPQKVTPEKTFMVKGGEGFLQEKELRPSGFIIATDHDRLVVGEEDTVYTDIGRAGKAKPGDIFSIFRKLNAVKHPVTNDVIGWRVASLGALRLVELTGKNSRALITQSYMEIGTGDYLVPYRERRREIPLKAADKNLHGYIVETNGGIITTGAGEIVYLDLGRYQGLKVGNLLYIVRDVHPDRIYAGEKVGALPKKLLGAMVVVETGEKTSTALIIKSVDAIYRGDQVELIKN